MYDFIKFEIASNVCPDLDKRFPAEYPRYKSDDMVCWTDCGCHWFISVPVLEEPEEPEKSSIQTNKFTGRKVSTV